MSADGTTAAYGETYSNRPLDDRETARHLTSAMTNPILTDDEWEQMRQRLETAVRAPVQRKHIRAIRVNSSEHWQPPLYIEVGQSCADLERNRSAEPIVAIFEAPSFMVITPERGLTNNLPYFFARSDIREVIEFD